MSTLANTNNEEFHGLPIDDTEQVERDPKKVVADERRVELVDEGNIVDEVQRERGENQSKGRGRRAATGLVFLLLIAACAVGGWYVIGNGAKRKAKVPVSAHASAESDEAKTKQAIEEANSSGPGVTLSDGSVVRPGMPSPLPTPDVPAGNVPVTELRPPNNTDLSGTVNSANPRATNEGEEKSAEQGSIKAPSHGRNTERSVRIGEEFKAPVKEVGAAEIRAEEGREDSGVLVPPFGSMLPVRSLGILYTLRSGGLARFELTREVKGNGWTMRRGTVFVGALRGAEFDRAYVSLVGFIDGESGRFVKLSGDLLGSDGGSGIRGKRRKVSGGWSRVLSKLGEAGLSVASAFAGSIGRRPIVINDAFGSYGGRVTGELDGVLGRDRNSFVEVAAGSSGYMMITELPDSVKGVDALSRFSGEDVEERSNTEQPRKTTGISERELAELIQSGDREQIRNAMPRMTPEMRRIAEAVISGDVVVR